MRTIQPSVALSALILGLAVLSMDAGAADPTTIVVTQTMPRSQRQCSVVNWNPVCEFVETTPEEACELTYPHANYECQQLPGNYTRAKRIGSCPQKTSYVGEMIQVSVSYECVPFEAL